MRWRIGVFNKEREYNDQRVYRLTQIGIVGNPELLARTALAVVAHVVYRLTQIGIVGNLRIAARFSAKSLSTVYRLTQIGIVGNQKHFTKSNSSLTSQIVYRLTQIGIVGNKNDQNR